MYDFAHPIQDAIEGITYSLCSLEFENHRPLYDWVIKNCGFDVYPPKQREFARLNVTYTLMSKRYLRYLVENNIVDGWDDPRLPTISALRRRGYSPDAIFEFIRRAGIAKVESLVDIELLEHCVREDLNNRAERRICVIEPVKLIIDNYPEDKVEYFSISNNPTREDAGVREVPFSKELYIEQSDFAEVPPPKFFRLKKGGEVRLMGAYIVKCTDIAKNEDGSIKEIHCIADLETGNRNPVERKVKGTIHWVSARSCKDFNVMYYDKLFTHDNMNEIDPEEYNSYLNPDSAKKFTGCKAEPSLATATVNDRFQFVRMGYFVKDKNHPDTFIRTVTPKDSFIKNK